jgi:serine/threonine protein kinase/Tol biopolymer transport system component
MPLAAGDRLGPYDVVAPLGAGGMGEVYRAMDTRLQRQVAIKVLPAAVAQDADRLARFDREAKAVAALSHPNILSIFDVGVHDGQAYAVTELLEGETLRARLQHGEIASRKAIDYAAQIARGLAAAHDKGIVHRDLKPENIFLMPDGRVKILDFGLARQSIGPSRSDATQTVDAMTEPGTVLGTVGYMAPEQVRAQAADARSDLFALGAVLYEMLSGQRAFQRDTSAETMTAILKEEPPEFAGARSVSPALDRIVRHCLEKNPLERFQSARDVAFALESLSGSSSSAAAAVVVPSSRTGHLSRAALIAALVLVAAVAGVLLGRAMAPPAASPVRFTMKTFEPQSILTTRFMPDGQSIVFSSALSGNAVQLYVIRSGTLEARPMGPPRTHLLSVSSKGELAVLTDALFVAHRVFSGTLARMSIEGSPRPWMEGVRDADWSPDGSTLAIVHEVGSKDRLEYPIGTVLYETAGYLSDPRVSPDGTRVAFMDHQDRFDDRGWVKVVDRSGKLTTLAGEFWGEQGLVWSRDGSTVFFAANDRQISDGADAGAISYQIRSVALGKPGESVSALTSPGDFMIHDIAPNGDWLTTRDDTQLGVGAHLAGETTDRDLSWLHQNWRPSLSKDGTRLLFCDGTVGGNYGVVWRGTDRSPIVRLGEGNTLDWSPDEAWVLAQIYSPPRLVLYPMGAGEPVSLKRGVIDQYQGALWFPDGKSLLVRGSEASKPLRAYRQEIPDGEPTPLLDEGVYAEAITPDGRTILGRSDAWYWFPVGGGSARPALGMTAADTPGCVVGWADDGRSFYVRRGVEIPTRIERIDVTSGRRELLKEITPANLVGLLNFDPVSVSHQGAQYGFRYRKRLSTMFVVSR